MAADRLSIEKKVRDDIVSRIDETKFLELDNASIQHIEMFMFAAAIGIKERKRTPLNGKIGFIQATAIRPEQMSAIFSLLVDEMRKENTEDKISDQDAAFDLIEEYANTGFYEIAKWITEADGNSEEKMWDLFGDLDDMYDEYIGINE